MINKIHLNSNYSEDYRNADPFSHIVLDDFLEEDFLKKIVTNFPERSKHFDISKFQTEENKTNYNPASMELGDEILDCFGRLNSMEILSFLERLTGIEALLPDPGFMGGGLHETFDGGNLGIHLDFNYHKYYALHRRMNMIIYLTDDWQEEYGGSLELWNEDMSECVKSVLPKKNRAVIFNTTDKSYHGHPDPMKLPKGVSRRSVALYYYTSRSPVDVREVEWTEHYKRADKKDYKFQGIGAKIVTEILPPILTRLIRRVL